MKVEQFIRICLKPMLIIGTLILTSTLSNAQIAVITGPNTVCPGTPNVYSAQAFNLGIQSTCQLWEWRVTDGLITLASGGGNSFTYSFNQVGNFVIRFRGRGCGFINLFQVEGVLNVQSRVKMPNPITSPGVICSLGQNYTFSSDPPLGINNDPTCYYHYEYFWNAPAGWSIDGGTNTRFAHGHSVPISPPTNTPPGTYTISIQSTIPNGLPGPPPNNAFLSSPRTISVRVGAFGLSEVSLSGNTQICNGNTYTYTVNLPGGHHSGYTYNWNYPAGWVVQNASGNSIQLFVPSYNSSYGPVTVSVNNMCGTSPSNGLTTFPSMNCNYLSPGNFKIFPNPSNGELKVEYDWSDTHTENAVLGEQCEPTEIEIQRPEFGVELYDQDQCLVAKGESTLGKYLLTHKLKPGLYFVHVYFGKDVIRKQIQVR